MTDHRRVENSKREKVTLMPESWLELKENCMEYQISYHILIVDRVLL